MFARNSTPNDLANHYQASRNAHASLERLPVRTLQLREAVDDCECGINGTLGCILLPLRITKVGEHAIAQELGDKPVERGNCPSTSILVAFDQRAHVFRVDLVSQ